MTFWKSVLLKESEQNMDGLDGRGFVWKKQKNSICYTNQLKPDVVKKFCKTKDSSLNTKTLYLCNEAIVESSWRK